jgi:AcrR family transcriptional regulator
MQAMATMSPDKSASPAVPAGASRSSARDRLLAAARELFYKEGINNVGIDRVIEHAGVAKASLYSNFGSKDELVRAYLRGMHERRVARIQDRIERHRSPRERILAVFDYVGETFTQPNYRGCAFVRTSAEMPGEGVGKDVIDEARAWMRELFTSLAREAGARNAPALAQQLVLLYDGAVTAAQVDGNVEAAATARALAAQLIDAAAKPAARSRA